MNDFTEVPLAPIRELSRGQRRVLGTLVEKGLTTPDGYPLTLKALTTGCNQKSNRDPVTNYSESQVEEFVEELRQIGLASLLQTDGGRADRYRHLVRKRFDWTEPQVAIMAELWLRGTQSVGELRQRASRMVPVDSLEELRSALEGLQARGDLQTSGPLDRRGVEVDHSHFSHGEGPHWTTSVNHQPESSRQTSAPVAIAALDRTAAPRSTTAAPLSSLPAATGRSEASERQVAGLEARIETLEQEVQELREAVRDLQTQLGV